jgi:hypothetical protein
VRGAQDEAAVEPGAVRDGGVQPPRPPGGKPLLRLIQLLESRGLDAVARDAVTAAVTEDFAPEVLEAAAELGLMPAQKRPARGRRGENPTSARGGRGRARARADAPASTAASEDIARSYLQAAARMGPPTGLARSGARSGLGRLRMAKRTGAAA